MAPRIVLITGTSSGLGLELAKQLLSEGDVYQVIGTSRSALEEGHELSQNKKYTHKQMDVTSCESVEKTFNEVHQEFKRLDVLVNNAAFGIFGTTEQTDLKRWHDLYETNVFGVVRCTNGALKIMRDQRAGQIINISSIAGFQGMPFNDTYVSSKFAMEGFTECQASYLHKFGIKISLVEPGPILTNFVDRVEKDHKLPDPNDAYSALTPEFEKMMGEQFQDPKMVQSAPQVAEVAVKAIRDYPDVQLRYQTSDFVKTAAADRWKDPTGFSLVEKYGRSTFSSSEVLPKSH